MNAKNARRPASATHAAARGETGATRHKETTMNETKLQHAILELIDAVMGLAPFQRNDLGLGDELAEVKKVRTYGDVGMLTKNAGLVITTADGSEFQLTIVQSR